MHSSPKTESVFNVTGGEVLVSSEFYTFDFNEPVKSVTFRPIGLSGWGVSKNIKVSELTTFNQQQAEQFANDTRLMV